MALRIRQVPHGSDAWRATVRLRDAVLRAPLGLAFTADELEAEHAQLHLALDLAGALAGTVVLVPAADTWKLRQMAIAPALQGRGLGRALLEAAECEMRDRGAAQVRLHARETAVAFYARLGYAFYARLGDAFSARLGDAFSARLGHAADARLVQATDAGLDHVADGAPFIEVTIPHRAMWKRFQPASI